MFQSGICDDLLSKDATELAACLQRGEFSIQALTARTLAAITRSKDSINAYVYLDREGAMNAARAADVRRRMGQTLSPFDGLTVAVKDNIDVAGMPTANGLGYRGVAPIAREDAAVVARLRAAGLIVLGKLNMHEIALGATNDNPHWGRCENPLRAGFTPGGSSGGSAAAVAAGLCAFALGTDTMGSVRIPASYCGVSGLKPGRDSVSTNGVTRLCRQLDTVGPLARSSRDLRALWPFLQDAGGEDAFGRADLASTHWALVGDFEQLGVAADISAAFRRFADALPGAVQRRRKFAETDFSAFRRAGLLMCEAEANVTFADELSQMPALFSDELQRLLQWGAARSAPDLVRAQDVVETAGNWLRGQLQDVDFLLTPTTLQTAFPFSQVAPVNQANLTACVNMAGLAAASIPLGVSGDGLPFGVQIIARAGAETALLDTCVALEQWLHSKSSTYNEMA
ncbi:amidase [Microbulbifer pacificus]|uniref:Amidase n=1 Tax=Microbulbifer pacificus TaxID=407164 RepID=A0AAU0N1E7_9GAMM|nr:amidase [Microbulbifer pacificus]WOX05922.1 amidase [Microbulbifer pacificus]